MDKRKRRSKIPLEDTNTETNNVENQNDQEDLHISDDEEGGTRIGDIYIPPPIKPYCSTESKGPRLIITKIENENFKSYAGKVTLGPFHHCFTSIVGPNGSGKSNVIDSMLFVFGYRAQKIRCKKLSVLLHNSAKCPNTQMCSVSVHFKQIMDVDDGYEEVPNSEIVIARTAFKDNSSFYTINGRRTQFKEVAKLLKAYGIDLDHNRFLILQGEVESIAMMKPKKTNENECGMLEYLEDIIGTTRYEEPLQKISALVENLSQECAEKLNRFKLAEREVKDLTMPYKEAVEYLKNENALIENKNILIQKKLSEKNKQIKEHELEMETVKTELEKHDQKASEIIKSREEKENLIKENSAYYKKLCVTKEELEQKCTVASNNYTETQNTMAATNKRRKQNKEQIKKLEQKLEDFKNIPKKNQDEIEECEKKVHKLSEQKSGLEAELQQNYEKLEEQTRPLIKEREKLETVLIEKKKHSEEAKASLSLVESELKIIQHDEITEKRKYESLKSSYEESTKSLNEKKDELEEIINSIPKIKAEINQKIEESKKCKKEEEMLYEKVMTYKAEISEKKMSMQATRSHNKVLDSLMAQKYEGNIPGILGRLGDLGGIDAKYDVAISTACGRLDNIVVDTVNTAQACIEHLKRYDIGRASFIALEKVQHMHKYCHSKISTPENVHRLFDLIKVEDSQVLPAFYFALRNTLVANDLDQGTRIAYGPVRYRVVTLRGDVIETSGTMSGGGRTQMRGKMGQKVATKTKNTSKSSPVVKKDLEQLEIKAEQIQSKINFSQERQGILEREIKQLQSVLNSKTKEEGKITITVKSLSEQLPRIANQLQTQKQRAGKISSDPKKVKQLQMDIEMKRNAFEKSEKITNKISDDIAAINKKIASIHGDKIKSFQQKIDNITKQLKNLNENISKLKVEITSSERNYKKTEKQIEDLRDEVKNAEQAMLSLQEKRTQYDNESNELQQKINDIKGEIEKAEKETSTVRNEISAIQKQENDFKMKRVEIEEKKQALDKKIMDLKSQFPHWKNKLKSLKLNEIPGVANPNNELKTYTEEELEGYELQQLEYDCTTKEEQLRSQKPNLSIIQEYLAKMDVYTARVMTLEAITLKKNEMRKHYEDVKKRRYYEFMSGFRIITKKLKELYQMITQGGDADLDLADSMDPFNEGVVFSVRPPKKTWKNISNLSGGEKTLSSLALVFALHYYKPSPLYFMDEIDAALDFKNISIVAHYIKERTKNAQFIIISLRSNMFELSDYIVGIYKVLDCTESCTVENCVSELSKAVNSTNNNNNNNTSATQQVTSTVMSSQDQALIPMPLETIRNTTESASVYFSVPQN